MQKVHGFEILKMNTEFTIDDDGIMWLTYAYDISARFKKNAYSVEHLKQIGFLNENMSIGDYNAFQTDNKHLDLTKEYLSQPHKASSKMYSMMSEHYNELKTKLGLIDAPMEFNDIFNDPIPIEDQFPPVVLKKMQEDQNKKLRNERKFQIKSRDEIVLHDREAEEIKKLPRGLKPHLISREKKLLRNNLLGVQSQSLVEAEDLKFVRHTNPSKPNHLRRFYEPPLKHYEIPSNNPFCTKSFTVANEFMKKRGKKTNRSMIKSHKKIDEPQGYPIDWTKVRLHLFISYILK